MHNRYYELTKDNTVIILGTVKVGDPLPVEILERIPRARVLKDADLYKLITEATNALNTKPYAP